MKTKILTTILLSIISLILSGQIIHVPGDQPTIQAGIDAAINGNIVLVDTGIYYENIDFLGKAITVASNYLNQKDSSFIFNTIINGSQPSNPDIGSVVSFVSGEDTSSCIYGFTITGGTGTMTPYAFPVCSGGGINIINAGCRIECNIIMENECILDETDGLATGGGISCGLADEDSYLIINNNLICNNTVWSQGASTSWEYSWGEGGGISVAFSSNGIIKHNRIYSNQCKSNYSFSVGGGIRLTTNLDQCMVVIDSNEIINNESLSPNSNAFGAGISCSGSNTIIERNLIRNNITNGAASKGSGIFFDLADTYYADVLNNKFIGNYCITNSSFCYGGAIGIYRSFDLNIVNNLFVGNSARHGGAFYISESHPTIVSNTIVDNSAEVSGGGFYFIDVLAGANVTNCILRSDSAAGQPDEIYNLNPDLLEITYSDVDNGWEGLGNIDEDPLFIGSGDHPYSLQDESPCVNTGTPDTSGLNLPAFDLAGNPRIYGGRIEMGAYENQNVVVGLNSLVTCDNFELTLSPNPFEIKTLIEFYTQSNGFVLLRIFNLNGRLIRTLISDRITRGNHQIIWNAENHEKGIYFIQIKTNEQFITKKVIVLQ